MKRNKFESQSIKTIFQDIKKLPSLKKGFLSERINSAWKNIMGDQINKYTDKIIFKDKTLFVYLTSAPLKEELHYRKNQILERLNKELEHPVFEEIIFN